MSVRIIWKSSDGTVIKGLSDCSSSADQSTPADEITGLQKKMVDSDLNHGTVRPGSTTLPQIVSINTFSWQTNGNPENAITGAGLYLDQYYSDGPSYSADTGKYFCDGSSSTVFGGYSSSGGSHTAGADYSNILSWGDDGYGVQVSLDRGSTYQTFKTGQGDGPTNTISLKATSMDVGSVDGQLDPGDRAIMYLKIGVPSTFNDPTSAGVYLFSIGLVYNYTE